MLPLNNHITFTSSQLHLCNLRPVGRTLWERVRVQFVVSLVSPRLYPDLMCHSDQSCKYQLSFLFRKEKSKFSDSSILKGQLSPPENQKCTFSSYLQCYLFIQIILVSVAESWKYQPFRCLPSQQYNGTKWHSVYGVKNAKNNAFEKFKTSVFFQKS